MISFSAWWGRPQMSTVKVGERNLPTPFIMSIDEFEHLKHSWKKPSHFCLSLDWNLLDTISKKRGFSSCNSCKPFCMFLVPNHCDLTLFCLSLHSHYCPAVLAPCSWFKVSSDRYLYLRIWSQPPIWYTQCPYSFERSCSQLIILVSFSYLLKFCCSKSSISYQMFLLSLLLPKL